MRGIAGAVLWPLVAIIAIVSATAVGLAAVGAPEHVDMVVTGGFGIAPAIIALARVGALEARTEDIQQHTTRLVNGELTDKVRQGVAEAINARSIVEHPYRPDAES